MRILLFCALALAAFGAAQTNQAQPPGERGPGGTPPNGGPPGRGAQGGGVDPEAAVARLLTLDVNADRILTIDEVNDPRLENLLKRADKDSDGQVTVEELTTLFTAEAAEIRSNRGGGPNGGFGGPGGPGRGMRRPGEIMPPFMQDELRLSEAQRAELAALQADVDARLKKILSEEQMQQLSQRSGPPPGSGLGFPGQQPQGGGRNGSRPPQE